ncbi:unnamed protein product [Boreogadus saida]
MAFFSQEGGYLLAEGLSPLTVVSLIPLKTGGRRRNWRLYPWESVATTQGSVVQLPQQMRCCWATPGPEPSVPAPSWGPGTPTPDLSVPGVQALWEPDVFDRVAQELGCSSPKASKLLPCLVSLDATIQGLLGCWAKQLSRNYRESAEGPPAWL